MLPSIGLLLSVEMIRDGGSLAASFQGSNGAVFHLEWLETMEAVAEARGRVPAGLARTLEPVKS